MWVIDKIVGVRFVWSEVWLQTELDDTKSCYQWSYLEQNVRKKKEKNFLEKEKKTVLIARYLKKQLIQEMHYLFPILN